MRSIIIQKVKPPRELTPREQAAIDRLSRSISHEPVEDDFEGDQINFLSFAPFPRNPALERTLQEYNLIHKENDHA